MDNIKITSRSGGKKGKSSANFPPVTVDYKNEDVDKIPENIKTLLNNFISSTSTESQLAVTKSILDTLGQLGNHLQDNVIKFLVLVLFESEPKHPVKCLLMRQVYQMGNNHEIFMKHLSQIILSYQLYSFHDSIYPEYAKFILRLSSCFENFPLCVDTVRNIVSEVFKMLTYCMLCCEHKLSQCLSTTEKLEVSKLLHQTLHLYLNVYHKAMLNENLINSQKINMTNILPKLVFRDDVSMDTKALCAVIQITMMKSEGKWSDPWACGYPMSAINANQGYWEKDESVLLCFYSALVTAAPQDLARRLDFTSSKDVAEHILTLIKNIVDITDRLSGSVSVSLCGARGLAAASNWLNAAGPKGVKLDKSDLSKNESDSDNKKYESDEHKSELNKSQSELNKKEYDSNKKQPDLNEEQSESNKQHPESDNIESELNKSESKSDMDESDSNKPQSDLDIPDPWLFPSELREYEEGEVYMGRTLALARLLARFAEQRLRHHVPAVRHLAEQIQANVMLYCLKYHPEEVKGWLNPPSGGCGARQVALLRRVGAAAAGGAALRRVLEPSDLLPQLDNHHKQPHVAALLETYIEKDCSELDSELVFSRWVSPTLALVRRARPLSAIVTDVLIKLLATALDIQDTLLPFILPLIENPDATRPDNLKCTLFLMNVISKSKVSKKFKDGDYTWKGLIGYEVLEAAILDDDDQIARLCTSVAWHGDVCSGARVVLALLQHAAHRPRALHADTRRPLTHFLKRFEKEYLSSGSDKAMYVEILQSLRSVCFSNLVRGANHYRRGVALFTLAAIASMQLHGYDSEWTLEEVETVLRHLDDSYETNKQMALEILKTCPPTLLREAVLSNNLDSIPSLLENVSCRVRDAEAAAYKLELLVTSLPDLVLQHPAGDQRAEIESVRHAACAAALVASHAPPYRAAALTLLRTQLERVPYTNDAHRGPVPEVWRALACRAIWRALAALEDAAPLVEAPSPEGLVPPIFFDIVVRPHHREPHLYLVGEEVMTSQTMLLYAWTCAKEAWLIVALAAQLVDLGALSAWWHALAGSVARARHRAVHDHATKAYTAVLRRLLSLGGERAVVSVGALAAAWVGGADGTRRAAGLAGLVLAVAALPPHMRYLPLHTLTTIHQTGAHHAAMALLRARETARAAHDVLPCFVQRALHDADSPDAALQWACVGVVGAAVRRVAGAHAPGEGEGGVAPGERGRLRTTVFMSRYPGLYPYILECLERGSGDSQPIRASVACSLLLLSRLLPDGASTTCPGTASAVHDGVLAATGSPSYHTRRLAAAAAAAALPSAMYLEHASAVLDTLSNKLTAKNLCHGLILRLLAMIHEAPELPWAPVFALGLPPTLWIVDSPCFPLLHEYLNLIIVLNDRYPLSLEAGYRTALGAGCRRAALGRVVPGAQLCAARALGVAAAMLDPLQATQLITDGLNSNVHEVCLASLECLASAQGESCGELPTSPLVWTALGDDKPALLGRLAHIMRTHVHLECRRQSLRVLLLEGAFGYIFGEECQPAQADHDDGDTWIVEMLCRYMRACDTEGAGPGGAPPCPGAQPLYARALGTHLHAMQAKDRLQRWTKRSRRFRACMERVSECVWAWSAAVRGRGARGAARDLLRDHAAYLTSHDDDSLRISLLVGAAAARLDEGGQPAPSPSARGEPALLLALALLDFGLAEQTLEAQYQSFDSEIDSELYEEGIWTDRCTDIIIKNYAKTNPGQTITPYIRSLIDRYKTLGQVCGIHLKNFEKLLKGKSEISDVHDKVELFVRKLKAFDASIQMSC